MLIIRKIKVFEKTLRKKIDYRLEKDKRNKSDVKPIYIGMTTSDVEAIMGKPFEVITNNNSKNNQLWIYKYQDKRSVMLTFTNYKLIKIED